MSETSGSKKIPKDVRDALVDRLGREASHLGWESLPAVERTRAYDRWANDPFVRQAVEQYLGPNSTRKYVKDTLKRRFIASGTKTPGDILSLIRLEFGQGFEPAAGGKQKGLLLLRGNAGGALCVAWGTPERWKDLIARVLQASDAVAQRRDGDEPTAAIVVFKRTGDSDADIGRFRRIAERCRVRFILREQ